MNRDCRREGCPKQHYSALVVAVHILLLCVAPVVDATEYFVDNNHPNASDSNDGLSLDRPFKTLERGDWELQPGNTLTIKAGVYREALVHGRSGTSTNPIVVRAYPGDEGLVVIKGSDVFADWTDEGDNVWSTPYQPLSLTECRTYYCQRREMAFIDGARQKQVLSRTELGSGRFWVDDAGWRLYIGFSGNLNDRFVELAVRNQGIWAGSTSHVIWKGLRVEHVANGREGAAMQLGSNHTVLNCIVQNNNLVGIGNRG